MQTNVRTSKPDSQQALTTNLKRLGANLYDLSLPETHTLLQLIQPNETVLGVVYGKYRYGGEPTTRGILVATDTRVLILNKKPLYLDYHEISYLVVSGVSIAQSGFATHLTLNTRMGDVSLRTFNDNCAQHFVEAVEQMLFTKQRDNSNDYLN